MFLSKAVKRRTKPEILWRNHSCGPTFEDAQDASQKGATPLKGDVAQKVAKLKQQPGQDVLIYGSGELVHTLMQQT